MQLWSAPQLVEAVDIHNAAAGPGQGRRPLWYPVLCRLPGASQGGAAPLALFYKVRLLLRAMLTRATTRTASHILA